MDDLLRSHDAVPVKIIPGGEYLLNIFFELSSGRHVTEAGLQTLSWQDISSYVQLMDEQLEPWEIRAIRLMDETFLSEAAKLKE